MAVPEHSGVIILYLLYGDMLITDPKTCALVSICIEHHIPLRVTNMAMGRDPKPGVRKLARVVYMYDGMTQVREALEYMSFNFSFDIARVTYGVSGKRRDDAYYRDKPNVLEALYKALDWNASCIADNATLLATGENGENGAEDPAPGTLKQLTITVRHFKTPGLYEADGLRGEDWNEYEYAFAENEPVLFPTLVGGYTMPGTGWVKDDPDDRDYTVSMTSIRSDINKELTGKEEFSLLVDRQLSVPVYAQGRLGSCSANAVAAAYQYELQRQKGQEAGDFRPSRLWLYYQARVPDDFNPDHVDSETYNLTLNQNSGTSIRKIIKALARLGACPEGPDITDKPDKDTREFTDGTWPYDGTGSAIKGNDTLTRGAWAAKIPPLSCYTAAAAQHHIPVHYARIERSVECWKACISMGYPVIFGFRVYPSFRKMGKDTGWIAPFPRHRRSSSIIKRESYASNSGSSSTKLGGHAVLAVGWNDNKDKDKGGCFRIQNSWGVEDGEKGFYWMPYDWLYMKSPEEPRMLVDDFWTLMDANVFRSAELVLGRIQSK